MPLYSCIICAQAKKADYFDNEHIIPKCVGGTLTLQDAVCKECNSKFGHSADHQILALPEVFQAFQALNIPCNKSGILKNSLELTGKATNFTLREGRVENGIISFPIQKGPDNSLLIPDSEFPDHISQLVNNSRKEIIRNLPKKDKQELIGRYLKLYSEMELGYPVYFPELNLKIIRRSDPIKTEIQSRRIPKTKVLIHKIGLEFLFFVGGSKIFCPENSGFLGPLVTLFHDDSTPGLTHLRVKPHFHDYRPFHFVTLKVDSSFTSIRVSLFSRIDFQLVDFRTFFDPPVPERAVPSLR